MGRSSAAASTVGPLLPTWLWKLLGTRQNGAWGHFPRCHPLGHIVWALVKNREKWVLGKQGHPFLLTVTPSQKEHQEVLASGGRGDREGFLFLSRAFFLATALAAPCAWCPRGQAQPETAIWRLGRTLLQKGSHTVPQTWAPQTTLVYPTY